MLAGDAWCDDDGEYDHRYRDAGQMAMGVITVERRVRYTMDVVERRVVHIAATPRPRPRPWPCAAPTADYRRTHVRGMVIDDHADDYDYGDGDDGCDDRTVQVGNKGLQRHRRRDQDRQDPRDEDCGSGERTPRRGDPGLIRRQPPADGDRSRDARPRREHAALRKGRRDAKGVAMRVADGYRRRMRRAAVMDRKARHTGSSPRAHARPLCTDE